LPARDQIEEDPRKNENEQMADKLAVDREHQMEVEEDDPSRDVLWPLEKVSLVSLLSHYLWKHAELQSIYNPLGNNAETSQLESAVVESTEICGFTHPTSQLLRDGTIQAIPRGRLRWSDEPDDLIRVRRRGTPMEQRSAFGGGRNDHHNVSHLLLTIQCVGRC
jgi:hypothetical protein